MKTEPRKLEFTSIARIPSDFHLVSCCTDGVSISSDNGPACEFKMEEGKRYKVTIEECLFQGDSE